MLISTALASTLLIGTLIAPSPAAAQTTTCTGGPGPGPTPILETSAVAPIICVNTEARTSNGTSPDAINLSTTGDDHYIDLFNSGLLTASQDGIYSRTDGDDSFITIENLAGIYADGNGIFAQTTGAATVDGSNSGITIVNSGDIDAGVNGIDARAFGVATGADSNSGIAIVNAGDVDAGINGIYAEAIGAAIGEGSNSGIVIDNAGDIDAGTRGIDARTFGVATGVSSSSGIAIDNAGAINADDRGISAFAFDDADGASSNSGIAIGNVGDIVVGATGIDARTYGTATGAFSNSGIAIDNAGAIDAGYRGIDARSFGAATGTSSNKGIAIDNGGAVDAGERGIYALTVDAATGDSGNSGIAIDNAGAINAGDSGIDARSFGDAYGNSSNKDIAIDNAGDIDAGARGIYAVTLGAATGDSSNSGIAIDNAGAIDAADTGIDARSFGAATGTSSNSGLAIDNGGDIDAGARGIYAFTLGAATGDSSNSGIAIDNAGQIDAADTGIYAFTFGAATGASSNKGITINNAGDINSGARGLYAATFGAATGPSSNSGIAIVNTGDIDAGTTGIDARAYGSATGAFSTSGVTITNSGNVFGGGLGVFMQSNEPSVIINRGSISAGTGFAIDTSGASSTIINANGGVIIGFVDLTDNPDLFDNQSGGTFEARMTSDFGDGDDLFRNEEGGTVHALRVNSVQPAFVNLERFENSGLISMIDGDVDDVFTISNTVGGTDLTFQGSGAVAVDAFLGPPGSTADNFIIDGNVFGQTQVIVNNTRPGGGVYNPDGIPVVFVPNGQVSSNAFYMPQPFDSGLFDWDVYFVPTGGGSGFFELRSFPGGGAHMLPQLLTAAQDIWHSTSETWFDRTADLRVLLNGGAAYGASGGKLGEGALAAAFTPGVWLKGSGSWLEQKDSASTTAYGRTYRYNLDRDLDLWNLQGGFDFGKQGMLAEGDALLFGVLGGVVLGNLDYDHILRRFEIEGGEVGGYVTYLNGGLFVDTLVKVSFLEFENDLGAPGLPGSLDSTTWGARTDAGYRFGGFRRGLFVEPLATLAVVWADIDNFSDAGNSVKFDDEANVRGRLGLRVGSSNEIWQGIVMEPFVIGSLWSNLSGDNRAFVTSVGTQFGPFTDEPDDLWGVVSAGVNFFSPGANTSIFGKVDVAFGEDTDGISAKGGMRYNW